MATEQQSNLSKAYERKNALNLQLTTDQWIELQNIIFDLSNQEYKKGLDKGLEIATKVYK